MQTISNPVLTRLLAPLVLALLVPTFVPAQNTPQEPRVQIQVDVVGDVIGKVVRSKGAWAEIRSQNFLVLGDASEKDLRQAASELELFRAVFAQVLPLARKPSSVPTRVLVMRGVGGSSYLLASVDVNYVVIPAGEKLSREMIRAYVPLLLRDSIGPAPFWFQEGLAEYFSTYKLDRLGDSRIVKLGLDEYKGNVKDKKVIPLPVMFSASVDSIPATDKDARKLFSAQACALVTYMAQTRGLGAVGRFLSALAEGQAMEPAFRSQFKLPMSVFEENFKRSVKVSRSKGWTVGFSAFTLNPDKSILSVFYANEPRPLRIPTVHDSARAETEALPMQVLTEAQGEYYRGDLLLHSGQLEAADPYLRNAIRLDGELASAHAALGRLYTLKGQYRDGSASFDRALQLDSNHTMAYYYAALLLRKEAASGQGSLSHREVERGVRAALRKTLELSPEFVEASEMLALSNLALRDDLDASVGILIDALKRSPGRLSLQISLAQVAAAGGQKPVAGWMLQRILASGAGSTEIRQEARDLLYQLDLTESQKSAFDSFTLVEPPDGNEKSVTVRLSSTQIEAARKQAKEEEKTRKTVRGLLTKVECSRGLTFYIQVGVRNVSERIENLHTDTPAALEWVDDYGGDPGPLECGPAARPVAITYRPQRKGLMMGVPLVIQFLSRPD